MPRSPLGEWTLVVNGDVIVGTVRANGVLYKIAPGDEGVTAIRQPSNPLREAPFPAVAPAAPSRIQPIVAPGPPRPAVPRIATDVPGGAEDGGRIDVLAVYTPTATELYGGEYQLRAELDLAIAETNQAYANSGVVQRLNLAFATEVDYVPHREGSVNVRRLQDPDDGFLDEVHALRDRYAADIVTLEPGGNDINGVSFAIMKDPSPSFEDRAFSSQGICGYCFAHEFGHLQGLSHDRYQMTQETSDDLSEHKPHPYSFGYVNQAALEPGGCPAARAGTRSWPTVRSFRMPVAANIYGCVFPIRTRPTMATRWVCRETNPRRASRDRRTRDAR